MTQKGLAFGASIALGAGLLAGAPAFAAGTADGSVTLLPTVGAEYTVRANDVFDLAANYDASLVASSRYLKFLVADPTAKTLVDVDFNGTTVNDAGVQTNVVSLTAGTTVASDKITYTAAGHGFVVGETVTISGSASAGGTTSGPSADFPIVAPVTADTFTVGAGSGTGAVTVTNATATLKSQAFTAVTFSGTTATMTVLNAANLMVGDVVTVAGLAGGDAADVNGNRAITKVVSSTSIQFTAASSAPTVTLNATAANNKITMATPDTGATNSLALRADIVAMPLGANRIIGRTAAVSARAVADNSYVVTGIDNSVANDQVVRLISTDTTQTVSVDVTAWVDNNGNGEIDPTEKVSATRTVTFAHTTGITATTTIRPATAGETLVIADVVTSPVLNGLMMIAADNENLTVSTITNALGKVNFTRQGDATEVASITNGSYSNTTKKFTFTSANFDAAGWTSTYATMPAQLTAAQTLSNDTASYSITANVANVVTGAAHGFRVGDFVVVTSSGVTRLDTTTSGGRKVTSVPTSSSFTYAVETAQESATNVVSTALVASNKVSVGSLLRNKVEAGALTAQFVFDVTGVASTAAATEVGVAGTYSVGAKVVGTAGLSLAGSPSATVNAAGKVAKGTTTANFVVSLKDALGVAVGAGVDVTLTAQRAAGASTITANGLAVGASAATTFYAKTDAAGTVTIALTNSLGAVADSVSLTANSQGATEATISAVWEAKIYTIHDLADANYNNSVRSRSVASGASYTVNFLVQDQWKSPAGADVRLKVTLGNRSVQTSIVELTNGQGSFVVTDGGLVASGDTTVQVEGQLKSATTGVWASADASFADWDGASGNDLAVVDIKYQAQSAIVLNANGANYPSTTAADLTADVTALTPVALDGRISYVAAPAFTAATKAVVSGSVTLANGVTALGSTVTVSGTGLAFKAGDIWALDTVTFATDGTFAVEVYSRTSGAKVVTVTSGAATKTATVTFAAIASTKGYSVALTAPADIKRGSTMKVEGQILDANGNGIPLLTAGTGAAATLQVSYLGLGLVSGVIPTTTDANGKFYFYVLVGSNDVGQATITASYDADGTGTTSAAVTVSKTVFIGQTAPSAEKVNAGSFKGYVALYAKGYAGKRMSAKVGKDWVVVPVLASDFERVVEFTGAGVDVAVRIYIDRVLLDTINLTTK